jgi:type VI secretion system FHA domain protein
LVGDPFERAGLRQAATSTPAAPTGGDAAEQADFAILFDPDPAEASGQPFDPSAKPGAETPILWRNAPNAGIDRSPMPDRGALLQDFLDKDSLARPLDPWLKGPERQPYPAVSPEHVKPEHIRAPEIHTPTPSPNSRAADPEPRTEPLPRVPERWNAREPSEQPEPAAKAPVGDTSLFTPDIDFGPGGDDVFSPVVISPPQAGAGAATPQRPVEPAPVPVRAAAEHDSADKANGIWAAFSRGLGAPSAKLPNEESAERAGAGVRMVIEGLAELLAARADLKRELRVPERTMLMGRNNNPLKQGLSSTDLLNYLFEIGPSTGFMPTERAIAEGIAELKVHESATLFAARATVEGALRDFEPSGLKKRLLNGKSGLLQALDNAKTWEAYERDYEKQSQQMADWLDHVFSRHFTPNYAQESERLKDSMSRSSDS